MTTKNGNSLCIQSFLLNLSIMILLDPSLHSVARAATRNPNNLTTKEESTRRRIVARSKEVLLPVRGDKNRMRTGDADKSRTKMLTKDGEETSRSMRAGVLSEIVTQYPRRNQLGESLRKLCRERASINRGMEMSGFPTSLCPMSSNR